VRLGQLVDLGAAGAHFRRITRKPGDQGYLYSIPGTRRNRNASAKVRALPVRIWLQSFPSPPICIRQGGTSSCWHGALHGNPFQRPHMQVALDDIQNIVGRSPLRAGSRIQRAPPHRPSPHCGVHHRAQTPRHRQDQTLVKAPRGRLLQRSARRRWFSISGNSSLPEQCPLFFFARVFICRSRAFDPLPPTRPLSKSNNDS